MTGVFQAHFGLQELAWEPGGSRLPTEKRGILNQGISWFRGLCICMHTHTHTHIYIYIYIHQKWNIQGDIPAHIYLYRVQWGIQWGLSYQQQDERCRWSR